MSKRSVMKVPVLLWDRVVASVRKAVILKAAQDRTGVAIYGNTHHIDLSVDQVKRIAEYYAGWPGDQVQVVFMLTLGDWVKEMRDVVFRDKAVKADRRRSPNPGSVDDDQAAIQAAVELSRKFHHFDPRRLKRVKLDWPKALVLLGPCTRLDYLSDKFDGKPRIYFHNFEKPAAVYAAEQPQPDGTNLLLIHGNFRIKSEGITG